MAFRVHHINKKTGVTYVYEATAVWDKDKHQARNKQVCIGKLDPVTGDLIPSKRLSPHSIPLQEVSDTTHTQVVGPSVILDAFTKRLGLDSLLRRCFPKVHDSILSIAYYLAARGTPLSHAETWTKSHAHPLGMALPSQRISEVLNDITPAGCQTFFREWIKRVAASDAICYDITSISSYSALNEYIKYGYNRDKESLPQLNLAMLFGQESALPVYFHRMPGNISDVSTLPRLIKTLDALGMPECHYVLDRGFYSQKNVDALMEKHMKFTLSVPLNNKWVQKACDEVRESIEGPEGYRLVDDEVLYVHSRLYPWGDTRKRCYLHLYYNAHARANAIDQFNRDLLAYKNELESNQCVLSHLEAYDTFFIVKETPKRGRSVSYNQEAVRQYISRYAGFMALLSNKIKDPVKALQVYRDKDKVEKCFDDLKNQLDMKRLRMHTSATADGRLFVQFIALIYISAIRRAMRQSDLIQKYSPRELLDEMDTFTKIIYKGKRSPIFTELTKPQRHILKHLSIPTP